jgi:hypothetical protein
MPDIVLPLGRHFVFVCARERADEAGASIARLVLAAAREPDFAIRGDRGNRAAVWLRARRGGRAPP